MTEVIGHSGPLSRPFIPTCAAASGVLAISGYASLWGAADLNGDVVQRGAFGRSLEATGADAVRMLHDHASRSPVGRWDSLVEDDHGLFVTGRIFDWSAESRFAQALARAGALDGLSIGFRARTARREDRLRVLEDVELWEVSLVTFPMLPGARFKATTALAPVSVGMEARNAGRNETQTQGGERE